MKKTFCWIFAITLSLSVLYGCAQQKDQNTVTLWHWMTDRHKNFKHLALKFEQKTGVKVNIELFANAADYSEKIIASGQARVLPDIYGILDKKEIFATFIESGFIEDLTDEFEANNGQWKKSLFDKALNVNRFEEGNIYKIRPGIYGVPLDVSNIQMLYNKNLLKKAGIEGAPKTFEDLITAVQALKRVGVPGLVSGWGETWMIGCFASNYAFNIMGEEKIMDTFRGKVPYTDPDWIQVFNIFKRLRDNDALVEGIVTKVNKYAELDFSLERAAFAFNGSWGINEYYKRNPDLEYGVMLPPALDAKYPLKIWGGAGSSFVVNKNSSRKEQAITFLKWLTQKEQQAFLARETRNLPSNREALESIPEVLSDFARGMEHITHPRIWEINEQALVAESFEKGIQAIIIGEKTPLQVAAEVQRVKVRELEKAKRRKR